MKGSILLGLSLLFAVVVQASVAPTAPPGRFTAKKFATISGRRMAYVEVGSGDPIVLLHGNPTSSYLWRNIIPHLEPLGRVIAPDLIGMGDSDKIDTDDPLRYSYVQHTNYLFQLLEKLGVKERVTLVLHDWGSAIGFLWAYYNRGNPAAVKAIVFFEAIVRPFTTSEVNVPELLSLRGPAGEEAVLKNNVFVESLLPLGILRNLTTEEMEEYRRPFLTPGEDRRPTLTFPRQIPIDGEPADVHALVTQYSQWLTQTQIPKLFIRGVPGVLLVGDVVEFVRTFPKLSEVVVEGLHFLQEDSPNEIGLAIVKWLPTI